MLYIGDEYEIKDNFSPFRKIMLFVYDNKF